MLPSSLHIIRCRATRRCRERPRSRGRNAGPISSLSGCQAPQFCEVTAASATSIASAQKPGASRMRHARPARTACRSSGHCPADHYDLVSWPAPAILDFAAMGAITAHLQAHSRSKPGKCADHGPTLMCCIMTFGISVRPSDWRFFQSSRTDHGQADQIARGATTCDGGGDCRPPARACTT